MLRHLRATNFAILSDVEIELGLGMNVLTGETGAGKYILVDWKRSKTFYSLEDYQVQLNVYRHLILKDMYMQVDAMQLVFLHPEIGKAVSVPVPEMDVQPVFAAVREYFSFSDVADQT